MSICKLSFLSGSGDIPMHSGLNWGSANAHVNRTDGYIPIRIENIKNSPDIFPPRTVSNTPVHVIWDDGTTMECLFEGTQKFEGKNYPKQISSYNGKYILGEYIRERMGIENGKIVTKEDFENYGRYDIDVSLKDDGSFYFDFSVKDKKNEENNNPDLFSEIEVEEEELGQIDDPFDPSLIDIDTKQPTISNVVAQIKNEEIDLQPAFQRSENLWSKEKQSRLIESILLRIPLPAFYFNIESKKLDSGIVVNTWQVIDGLQRLCSIKNFMLSASDAGDKLVLEHLEFLTALNGKTFDNLPRPYQRIIEETQFTAYLIKPGTPVNVKFNIFKRVNTGGIPLTQQEIRHALNQGIAADFLKELAAIDVFKMATYNKISSRRMLDREFVNRFLAFFLNNLSDYQSDMDVFLNSTLKKLKSSSSEERKIIKESFEEALILSIDVFGRFGFCKLDQFPNRKPINKAIFEVITVLFAKLNHKDRKKLLDRKQVFFEKYIDIFKNDVDFISSITGGTGEKGRVKTRFETVEKLINEVLSC